VHESVEGERVTDQVNGDRDRKLRPLSAAHVLALGIAATAIVTITYFTLFPFDFVSHGQSPSDVIKNFSLTTGPLWKPREVPINTVLFMPLGFGLAGLARAKRLSRRSSVVAGTALGLLLSVVVELLQSAWLLRDPSIDDIAANTVGATLGALIWIASEAALDRRLERDRPATRSPLWRGAFLALSLVPIVLVILVAIRVRDNTELAGWDPQYPLVLGNEATGNRPWQGSIAHVSLANRSLTEEETSDWLGGASMTAVAPESTLLDYDFASGVMPPGWQVHGSDSTITIAKDGLQITPQHWVQATDPVSEISRSIAQTDSFTVAVDATTSSMDQSGPARLLSISTDPLHRNLTVAQNGTDLVVRVRSAFTGPNAGAPEFVVPGVFEHAGPQRVVISYQPSSLRVSVGEPGKVSRTNFFPATVAMLKTFPDDDIARLRMTRLGDWARGAYLSIFMFAPWTICVTLLDDGRRARLRTLVLAVLPVPVVEGVLAAILPSQSFSVGRVLLVGAAAVALSLLISWSTARPPAPSAP